MNASVYYYCCSFLVELSWQKPTSDKFVLRLLAVGTWSWGKTLTVESWTARERSEGASEVAPLDPTQGSLHCVGPVALQQSNVRSLGKRDDDYENERGLCERLNRTVITLHNHNSPSRSLSLIPPARSRLNHILNLNPSPRSLTLKHCVDQL